MDNKKNLRANVIFADGTTKPIHFSPEAWNMINSLAGGFGLAFNFDATGIVAIVREGYDGLDKLSSPERRAIFTLGQKDMREAVCALLRDEAKKATRDVGFLIYELIDRIEELEVLNADA